MTRIARGLGGAWRALAAQPWTSQWCPRPFALEGGVTDVVELGEGPPVLLVPPLPGFKEAWAPCAVRLARRHRVVTFDLRERFGARAPWDAMLDDLDRITETFAPEPLVLVGHSLGGALAQRWALARPGRVRALVLSSAFARVTTPRGDRVGRFVTQPLVLAAQRWLPESLAAPLGRRLAARRAWVYDPACDDAVLALVRCGIRRVSIPLALARVGLAFGHDLRAALPGLAVPTLIVVGERETTFAREASAELAGLIPGAVLRESPGAAHLHPLSSPAWLAETIEGWAEALPRTPAA